MKTHKDPLPQTTPTKSSVKMTVFPLFPDVFFLIMSLCLFPLRWLLSPHELRSFLPPRWLILCSRYRVVPKSLLCFISGVTLLLLPLAGSLLVVLNWLLGGCFLSPRSHSGSSI
jgi:hypothetical protein